MVWQDLHIILSQIKIIISGLSLHYTLNINDFVNVMIKSFTYNYHIGIKKDKFENLSFKDYSKLRLIIFWQIL